MVIKGEANIFKNEIQKVAETVKIVLGQHKENTTVNLKYSPTINYYSTYPPIENLSLINITPWEITQSLPMETSSHTKECDCILHLSRIITFF